LLLDESPLKPIQRWLWVLSTGGTLLDGFVIFALGVAMPLIIAAFHIRPGVVGLIGAALVLGAVFGAGLGGPVADRLGRKRLMLADMIIIGIGAATSALANGPTTLFIGQLLVGVGIGIDFPVSSTYISEVSPKRSRARMMVATIACQSVGMLLAAAITLLLLKNVGGAQNWRLFLATEGIIALLFFLLRLSEPDSPHWLMTRGKFAKAAQAFIRIMPEQRGTVLQLIGNAGEKSLANSVTQARASGLAVLFSRPYRARTVLVAVPWFLMDIATYGVGLFTPIILGAIDISGRNRWPNHARPRRCQGKRRNRLVPALRISAGNLGGSTVWTHPDADHRLWGHGCGHADTDESCSSVEFSRRRGTHSAGVRRVHPIQLVDERRTQRHDVYARTDPVSDAITSHRQRIRS